MERRFTEFRDEVRQGQEDAAAKALKRARLEKPYTFRRKGNEEQAVFNGRLDETVAEAEAELAAAPTSVAQSQGIMRARETEYTADELAEDSGDEKIIEKAEKAAEHTALKRRKRGGMGTAGRSRTGRIPQGPSSAPPGAPPPFHQPATSAPRRPFPPGYQLRG